MWDKLIKENLNNMCNSACNITSGYYVECIAAGPKPRKKEEGAGRDQQQGASAVSNSSSFLKHVDLPSITGMCGIPWVNLLHMTSFIVAYTQNIGSWIWDIRVDNMLQGNSYLLFWFTQKSDLY